jgi:hypothetical protein
MDFEDGDTETDAEGCQGVAVRGINIGDVRALQLPVPPLAEQQEIIRRSLKTAGTLEAR